MTNLFFALQNMIFTASTKKVEENGDDYTVTAFSSLGIRWEFEHDENGGDAYNTISAELEGDLFALSYNDLDGVEVLYCTSAGDKLLRKLKAKYGRTSEHLSGGLLYP